MKTIAACLMSLFVLVGATASAADTTAPQLDPTHPITISPGAVDVTSSSKEITVTLHITDDESGLAYANIYLIDSSDDFVVSGFVPGSSPVSGGPLNGFYSMTVSVPLYAQPGTWRVDARLQDVAGNVREIGPGNQPYPVPADALIVVTNGGTIDIAGPEFQSFTASPETVFTADSTGQVTATVRCTDALSGFKYGFIYVDDAQGNFRNELVTYFQDTQRTSGDAFDGTYTIPVRIPQDSVPGTWQLSVYLRDEVGNSTFQPGSPSRFPTTLHTRWETRSMQPSSSGPPATRVGSVRPRRPTTGSMRWPVRRRMIRRKPLSKPP